MSRFSVIMDVFILDVLFNTVACLLHMKETVLRSWKLLVSVILPIYSGIFLFVRSYSGLTDL